MFDKKEFLKALKEDDEFRQDIINLMGEEISQCMTIEIYQPEAMSSDYLYNDNGDKLSFSKMTCYPSETNNQ